MLGRRNFITVLASVLTTKKNNAPSLPLSSSFPPPSLSPFFLPPSSFLKHHFILRRFSKEWLFVKKISNLFLLESFLVQNWTRTRKKEKLECSLNHFRFLELNEKEKDLLQLKLWSCEFKQKGHTSTEAPRQRLQVWKFLKKVFRKKMTSPVWPKTVRCRIRFGFGFAPKDLRKKISEEKIYFTPHFISFHFGSVRIVVWCIGNDFSKKKLSTKTEKKSDVIFLQISLKFDVGRKKIIWTNIIFLSKTWVESEARTLKRIEAGVALFCHLVSLQWKVEKITFGAQTK